MGRVPALLVLLAMAALCSAMSVKRPPIFRRQPGPIPFPRPGGPVDCCGPNPIILCANVYCPPEDILARAKRQTTVDVSGGSGGVTVLAKHKTKKVGTISVSGTAGGGRPPSWKVGWSITLGKKNK